MRYRYIALSFFQYLSLRLLFEEGDLFHFYVSFVWRFAFHFEVGRFGGLKSGRRGLLSRAKRPFPVGPWCFHPGFKLTARRLPLASNGQGTQISADHAH